MTIIEIAARPDGGHGLQSQSGRETCWLEGWIEVPTHLEQQVWDSLGWCNLQIENGVLVGIVPTEKPEPEPLPDPEPSDTDVLNVLLGVTV